MDNKLLNDRISRLKEWEQPESLNEILFNALSSLNAYTKERFDELSREIEMEAPLNPNVPVIKIAVCDEQDIGKQVFLYPVAAEPPVQTGNYITTVFAQCDYLTIKDMINHDYMAEVSTPTGIFKTKAALRYSERYLHKLEALYYTFSENKLPWSTVNGVYFYKFLDVYGIEGQLPEVTGFEIDFAQYGKYVSYDKALLWNVNAVTVAVNSCEMKPAYDSLVYEHTIKNLEFDVHQYIMRHIGERFTCYRRGQILYVRTYSKQLEQLDLLSISTEEDAEAPLYLPLKTNERKHPFINGLAGKSYIPTRGEAERIIRSVIKEPGLRLIDIKVLPYSVENIRRYKGINFNRFVEKTTFLPEKKLLLFTFDIKINDLWDYEIMYFILSELQLYFYEYRCVGEKI